MRRSEYLVVALVVAAGAGSPLSSICSTRSKFPGMEMGLLGFVISVRFALAVNVASL
jgi:hypothetical protein